MHMKHARADSPNRKVYDEIDNAIEVRKKSKNDVKATKNCFPQQIFLFLYRFVFTFFKKKTAWAKEEKHKYMADFKEMKLAEAAGPIHEQKMRELLYFSIFLKKFQV